MRERHSIIKEEVISKLNCLVIAKEIVNEVIQIHSTYGFFKNNRIENYYPDWCILQIKEGTAALLRLIFSWNYRLK